MVLPTPPLPRVNVSGVCNAGQLALCSLGNAASFGRRCDSLKTFFSKICAPNCANSAVPITGAAAFFAVHSGICLKCRRKNCMAFTVAARRPAQSLQSAAVFVIARLSTTSVIRTSLPISRRLAAPRTASCSEKFSGVVTKKVRESGAVSAC